MSSLILKGAPVAAAIYEGLRKDIASLPVIPKLAIVRVGERPDDIAYEKSAIKKCADTGVDTESIVLSGTASQDDLVSVISSLCGNKSVHGVLLLRPLPSHIDEASVTEVLSPSKDVDSVTPSSLSSVFSGSGVGYPPCTAQACIEILKYYGIELQGKKAVVLGRSLVIGKPVAMLLLNENATVTICHTKTDDAAAICRESDIIISAAGRANTVTDKFVSGSQTVIDVGINVGTDGKIRGDVDYKNVEPHVKAITPVPGGVGSVTTAVLISHVVDSAKKQMLNQPKDVNTNWK